MSLGAPKAARLVVDKDMAIDNYLGQVRQGAKVVERVSRPYGIVGGLGIKPTGTAMVSFRRIDSL